LEEGHLQGVFDELGAHVIGERPADDSSRGEVDHRRQVREAFPWRDVGDVADVATVGDWAGCEITLNEVPSSLGLWVGDGRRAPPPLAASLDAGLAHEACDPAAADLVTVLRQLRVNPRRSIRATRHRVDLADLGGENGIGHLAL